MSRVLVLCIDRDDDLGKKTGISGPVVGAEKNIKAATALLEADPGESDGNAMFEAVKVFRELGKEAVDVVTLSGDPSRGYKADKEIARQLDEVLKNYTKLDGVYLVTDGADDDQLIPIIHSRTKILSKKTLIIKQAKELEKSYYVIKQLLQEPSFARIIFGLPGVILLTISFFQDLGLRLIILLIGLYLMAKGFGIEEPFLNSIRGFRETTSIDRVSFPIYIGSLLMIGLAIWAGAEKLMAVTEDNVILQTAGFITGFTTLFTVGITLFLLGRVGDMIYRKENYRIKKYMMSFVSIIVVYTVVMKAVDLVMGRIFLDEFILWLLLAFMGSIIGFNIVKNIYINRFIVKNLKKDLEVYNENGEKIGKITELNLTKDHITIENNKEKGKIPLGRIVLVTDKYISVRTK